MSDASDKNDKYLEDIVGALCDPLVVYPSGWMEDLPEDLKKRLPTDRLIHNMLCLQGKASPDEACDLEALLYMYPRTLEVPLSEQWTRIYLYLGTKVMGPDKIPEDIKQETLTEHDMRELTQLKRWIQAKKLEARKKRSKGQSPQEQPQEQVAVVGEKWDQNRLLL